MRFRAMVSSVFAAGAMLAILPVGCGGAQEDYAVVYPAQEVREPAAVTSSTDQKAELDPVARRRAEACLAKHEQPWSMRAYNLRYDAQVNENGAITNVTLGNTTLPDDVERCLR